MLLNNTSMILRKKIFFLSQISPDQVLEEAWQEAFSCFASVKLNYNQKKTNLLETHGKKELALFKIRKNNNISYDFRIKFGLQIFQIEKILDFDSKNKILNIIASKIK